MFRNGFLKEHHGESCVCRTPSPDTPSPRTPRIEAGEKVVLPDGQVRTIDSVSFALETAEGIGAPTGLRIVFTERWSPNV